MRNYNTKFQRVKDVYLLKFLTQCGIASRRRVVDLIKQGHVQVSGIVERAPFAQISDDDEILCDGKPVKKESFVYILLNKPKGYLTACADDRGRKIVMELIEGATEQRVYPVGRLDRMSTGLLLFTNDGQLAQKLGHPSGNVPKRYRVLLNKPLAKKDFESLQSGITLEDGSIKVDAIAYHSIKDKRDVIVQLHSGRNRIVRRMFQHLHYHVEKLDRIGYANLTLENLPRGEWRYLTQDEVGVLRGL